MGPLVKRDLGVGRTYRRARRLPSRRSRRGDPQTAVFFTDCPDDLLCALAGRAGIDPGLAELEERRVEVAAARGCVAVVSSLIPWESRNPGPAAPCVAPVKFDSDGAPRRAGLFDATNLPPLVALVRSSGPASDRIDRDQRNRESAREGGALHDSGSRIQGVLGKFGDMSEGLARSTEDLRRARALPSRARSRTPWCSCSSRIAWARSWRRWSGGMTDLDDRARARGARRAAADRYPQATWRRWSGLAIRLTNSAAIIQQ